MIVTKVRSVQINEFIHVTEKLFMNTRYQMYIKNTFWTLLFVFLNGKQ